MYFCSWQAINQAFTGETENIEMLEYANCKTLERITPAWKPDGT